MHPIFAPGQPVRLIRAVWDSNSGYEYPEGSVGKFEQVVECGPNCLIWLDKSQGDSLDSGEGMLLCALTDIEAI